MLTPDFLFVMGTSGKKTSQRFQHFQVQKLQPYSVRVCGNGLAFRLKQLIIHVTIQHYRKAEEESYLQIYILLDMRYRGRDEVLPKTQFQGSLLPLSRSGLPDFLKLMNILCRCCKATLYPSGVTKTQL